MTRETRSGSRRLVLVTVAAIALLAIVRAQPASRGPSRAPFRVEALTSPAGADSMAPQLTVDGDRVILSWIEVHDEAMLKFAERTSSGWSDVRTVVSSESLMVMPADVPSVRALPGGALVAVWPEENGGDDESYDLRVARSTDAGRTWSKPATPHHDGTKTQHGFASIFSVAGGGFGLVWLDGRATHPEAHDLSQAGSMSLRAAEFDAAGVQRGEALIDARVCDCCPLATAMTAEGPLAVFRDRSTDEIRDIAVSRLTAGKWTTPQPVHRDGWKISGCPVNGPAVSAERADVAVAWFTGALGGASAFAAFSTDAGRTFGVPIRVDDGTAVGRVQTSVLSDRSAAVSWIESVDSRSQLKLRRIERGGSRSASVSIAEGLGTSHPRLVRDKDALLLSWVEYTRGSTLVRTARAFASR